MAYDDFYIDKVTMRGNCDVDSTGIGVDEHADDAPGQPAGCKFLAPGEPATTERANRTRLQLAENCDILKGPLDAMIAVGQVASLNSFGPASSITINPLATGGSDIEFSTPGYLYMGNATDYGDNQESRDTLFQLVDSDYNEVLVGGAEVKVSATAPVVPGVGFYNTGVVTLTLSDTIPAGDYRLIYAGDSSIATLPEDTFIRSEIRGVHEAAGEVALKGAYVLDPSAAPTRPADFIGPTCLQDALTALGDGCVLFLRKGTYATGALEISQNRVSLYGESHFDTIIQPGSGNDFTISGDDVHIENMYFDLAAGQKLEIIDTTPGTVYRPALVHVTIVQDLVLGGSGLQYVNQPLLDRVRVITSAGFGLYMCNTFSGTIRDSYFSGGSAQASPACEITGCYRLEFSNTQFEGGTGRTLYIHETLGSVSQISFRDCTITGQQGATLPAAEIDGASLVMFDNSTFFNSLGLGSGDVVPTVLLNIPDKQSMFFRNCSISSTNRAVFHSGTVFGQLVLDNCILNQAASGTPAISGDEIVSLLSTDDGEISVRNLTITVDRYTSGGSGCVSMAKVRGSKVRFDFTGFTGGITTVDPMVYLNSCYLNGVVVDFGDLAPEATGGAEAAVYVRDESLIKDLLIKGLDGDWGGGGPSLPALRVEGSVGGGGGLVQAVVDGLRLESDTSWIPNQTGTICIEQYGTVRHLEWFDIPYASAVTTLIRMGWETSPTRAKLLDSSIFFNENEECYQVVGVYGDGDDFEICNNIFTIYAWQESSGPPPEIWPRRVVNVGLSASLPTWPDPDETVGQKFGKICNNTFWWRSATVPYDLDPPLGANGAFVFMNDGAMFCTVHDNFFKIQNSMPNGNYAIWVDNASVTMGGATLSNAADGQVNGHTFFGNKVWVVDQVATAQGVVFYSTGTVVGGDLSTTPYANQAVGNTT